MSNNGFTINKIVATSPGAAPIVVKFTRGLNVVSGASNTGKTYLFQCIDYLMGAERVPKETPESAAYSDVFLELQSFDDQVYTLGRSLRATPESTRGNQPIILYYSSFDNISGNTEKKELALNSRAKSESVSSFFLSLSGIERINLRRNQSNAQQTLSFRSAKHLFMVDETAIIKEPSPAYIYGVNNETASRNQFRYLITGEVAYADSTEMRAPKSGAEAKISVLDELIDQLNKELEALPQTDTLSTVNARLERAGLAMRDVLDSIKKTENNRESLVSNLTHAKSELLVLDELLTRFDLLEKHYKSDLKRLSFLEEGGFLFDQLQYVQCPFCQTSLDSHSRNEACNNYGLDIKEIEKSCEQERLKISLKLTDLSSTIESVRIERSELESAIISYKSTIQEIDDYVKVNLFESLDSIKSEMASLAFDKNTSLERDFNLKRLEQLQTKKAEFLPDMQTSVISAAVAQIPEASLASFCSQVESLINDFKVYDSAKVTFNNDLFDLVIDGKNRRDEGKGKRAITHSAFVLGLLLHCKAKDLPHPRVIVLDSPITSYRQSEQGKNTSPVEEAFYKVLSDQFREDQVIILENVRPENILPSSANLQEFTGDSNAGRTGFF